LLTPTAEGAERIVIIAATISPAIAAGNDLLENRFCFSRRIIIIPGRGRIANPQQYANLRYAIKHST
jgi:hypothetical protein